MMAQDESRLALEKAVYDEGVVPIRLPLSLLEEITGNFSPDEKIGRGGFAAVYKVRKTSSCLHSEITDQHAWRKLISIMICREGFGMGQLPWRGYPRLLNKNITINRATSKMRLGVWKTPDTKIFYGFLDTAMSQKRSWYREEKAGKTQIAKCYSAPSTYLTGTSTTISKVASTSFFFLDNGSFIGFINHIYLLFLDNGSFKGNLLFDIGFHRKLFFSR